MKHTYLNATAIFVVGILVALSGCETASRMAKKINGDWSGTTVRFSKKTDINGSFTPIFRFEQNGDSNGGNIILSADVSVMMPVNAAIDSVGTTAVSATAAGVATVRGTWFASDDDEVRVQFDVSTLTVDMDPDVEFELANIWTSTDTPTERTVSEAVKKAFTRQMTDGMTYVIGRFDKIDDIEIKDNLMTAKVFGETQTFTRLYQ